jgi:hypothetical protein
MSPQRPNRDNAAPRRNCAYTWTPPACQARFFGVVIASRECSYTSGLLLGIGSLALMEFADRYLINGANLDVRYAQQA